MCPRKNLSPYTSLTLPSLKSGDTFLQDLLSSTTELPLRKIDKPVILYGAGQLGKIARHFLDYIGEPFQYVVDIFADRNAQDKFWREIKVVHPHSVPKQDKENCILVICIVTAPLISLRADLEKEGWKDIVFFYDLAEAYHNHYPLQNGWFLGRCNDETQAGVRRVFSMLADDTSRAHYLRFLAWRRLRIELFFEDFDFEIELNNRFFIPEIVNKLTAHEIFVDCGAYDGVVIRKFVKIVNEAYKKIYAFEPDDISFAELTKLASRIPRIKIFKYALGAAPGVQRFHRGFGLASRLGQYGNEYVKTVTLDSILTRATFIKMHLEGGELNALRGGMLMLKANRPIVTVTVYHTPDGAYKLPLFPMDHMQQYRHYFRLHSWAGTGAVCYAIPNERKVVI